MQAKKSHAEVSQNDRMRARRGHLRVHVEVTCACLSINNFLAYHAKEGEGTFL